MNNSVNFNFAVDEDAFKQYLSSVGRVVKDKYLEKSFSYIFKEIVEDESFKATVSDYIFDLFVKEVSIHGSESMDRNCWQ
jgi:hypothetical protein